MLQALLQSACVDILVFGRYLLIQCFFKPLDKVWQFFLPLLSDIRFPLCQEVKYVMYQLSPVWHIIVGVPRFPPSVRLFLSRTRASNTVA